MTHSESDLTDKIALIIGQTDYSADEAIAKLKTKNYNELAVIREYLGSGLSGDAIMSKPQAHSKNQLIYTEIRKFMDGCIRADPDKANSADNTTY